MSDCNIVLTYKEIEGIFGWPHHTDDPVGQTNGPQIIISKSNYTRSNIFLINQYT